MRRVLCLSVVSLCLAAGATAGEKGTPEQAKALLDEAVKAMEADPAAALAAFNEADGEFVDRDLYVFCFTDDGEITAHLDPEMVGSNAKPLKDPEGKPVGEEMLALAEKGGGSVEYKWTNPVTEKVETKISFLKAAGDQTCGVGAYK